MNKLVISKEQEEEVKLYKGHAIDNKEAMFFFTQQTDLYYGVRGLHKAFTPEQFALLLCGWYEVEESFQVGEWALLEGHGLDGNIIGIVEYVRGDYRELDDEKPHPLPVQLLRKATAEEIAQEKKRRFWANLYRKVNQYHVGDIFSFEHDDYHRVTVIKDDCVVNELGEHFGLDEIKLVCPAEKRVDL